jgi:hypothetical protein
MAHPVAFIATAEPPNTPALFGAKATTLPSAPCLLACSLICFWWQLSRDLARNGSAWSRQLPLSHVEPMRSLSEIVRPDPPSLLPNAVLRIRRKARPFGVTRSRDNGRGCRGRRWSHLPIGRLPSRATTIPKLMRRGLEHSGYLESPPGSAARSQSGVRMGEHCALAGDGLLAVTGRRSLSHMPVSLWSLLPKISPHAPIFLACVQAR